MRIGRTDRHWWNLESRCFAASSMCCSAVTFSASFQYFTTRPILCIALAQRQPVGLAMIRHHTNDNDRIRKSAETYLFLVIWRIPEICVPLCICMWKGDVEIYLTARARLDPLLIFFHFNWWCCCWYHLYLTEINWHTAEPSKQKDVEPTNRMALAQLFWLTGVIHYNRFRFKQSKLCNHN